MSQQSQHNDPLPPAPDEQDVLVLVKRIQQQLISLEKKIDLLASQSQARPFSGKPFSKPFRSFGPPHRHPGRDYDNASREKSFDRARHFKKRHGEKSQGFDQKKEPFYSKFKQKDTRKHH